MDKRIRGSILLFTILVLSVSALKAHDGFKGGSNVPARNVMDAPEQPPRTACNNSEGLPPVGNQVVAGSCYAWAAAYYYLTHLQWQEYGWNVNDPAHQCSPAFVYNLTNGGVDNGASTGEYARRDAFKVFETMGCATMADMRYRYNRYRSFPDETTFRNGMRFRTLTTHYIETDTPSGIQNLKDHLLEGNLAVLGIFGYENLNNIHLYDDTYCVSQTTGGRLYWHEVTVIGFDDSLATPDGLGAFRIVNSLGSNWGDSGFFWMSYEAVMDSKTASGYAMYATDRIGYEPTLTARLEVEHSDRYNLTYRAGFGQPESPDTVLTFFDFNPMSLQTGLPYPEGAIVLDCTDMVPFIDYNSPNEIFITIVDHGVSNGHSGTIVSLAIEDLAQERSALCNRTPIPIPDSDEETVAAVFLTYSYFPPEIVEMHLPDGTESCPYSESLEIRPGTGTYPIQWSVIQGILPGGLTLNNETGEISGEPGETGTFDFTVQVTDQEAETDSRSFSITVIPYTEIKGDVNGDCAIDVLDALMVVNIILALASPTQDQIWRADCNGDEEANILDALGIVNVILGTGSCEP